MALRELLTVDNALSLVSLAAMEVVLGIDNLVFVSILSGKLQQPDRDRARRLGLTLALVLRIGLLLAISWVMKLTTPLFHLGARPISGRDLILLIGGLFLIGKSTHEIYDKVESHGGDDAGAKGRSFMLTLVQIIVLDMVFSLDSVITAVGMVDAVEIMIVAMLFAVGVMLMFARRIGDFVNEHPSMKILALSFLIMIGAMLVAEGLGQHINKATIYTAMAFSLVVELLNMRFRKKAKVAAPLPGDAAPAVQVSTLDVSALEAPKADP